MNPKRFRRLREVLERRQPDLTVLLENVHKPHNFAAVLRTADAVGLYEAHAVVADRALRTSLVSASGSDKWVRVRIHGAFEEAAQHLRQRGFRLLAAHFAPNAVDYREIDFTQRVAVLFGQEKDGLTEKALAAADKLVSIPMEGLVTSLNVSVAAATILFEAHRQRTAAGLYQVSRLDPRLFERTLFEWAYPRLADYCRPRGISYPQVDASGELLDEIPR
jgi:tRNA (guanosine-2'-O-)-methyltransferase